MSTNRVLTDQPWADVVVDLRMDRSLPLPTRPFAGRRKAQVGDVAISGTRRQIGHSNVTQITKWTDETGFTGAVMTTDAPNGGESAFEMRQIVPLLDHLTTEHRNASTYHNVVVPKQRGEAAFARFTPGLREILTDGTLTSPLTGAVDSRMMMAYRLSWAGVGVTDVTMLPNAFRDWDRVPPFIGDNRADPRQFPEDLTLRGPLAVATWLRHGWDSFSQMAPWFETYVQDLSGAVYARTGRAGSMEELAEWDNAGFTPAETTEWFEAARYNPNTFSTRYVPAALVAEIRRTRGVTIEQMSRLTFGLPDDAPTSAAVQHVKTWLNVSADVDRVCAYMAAGIGKAEAKAMERSAEPPSMEQLQVLAALLATSTVPTN